LSTTSFATEATLLEDELLRDATLVFQRAVDTPAAAIPASILMQARAIAVIPAAVKDEVLYRGLGVVSVRGAIPANWTPPAVIAFEGAIPVNLEATTVDFVLVARTPRGLDYLTQERFASPVTQPIVAGPLGQHTAVRMSADLVAYMQFGDYFAGVAVEDAMIAADRSSNARLYGTPWSTEDIVRGAGFFRLPPAARHWRDALAAYFREMS